MKLSMACVVAALSLTAAACADEVPTSGDSEVNVGDTKSSQDPKTRAIRPASSQAGQLAAAQDWFLIRFPEARGMTVEELPGPAMSHTTGGITEVSIRPANAALPFQGDRVLDRNTDCISGTYLTEAMNSPSGDINISELTNALNHEHPSGDAQYANLIIQHDNNGTVDTATIMTVDGTSICQVVQTRQAVISNTCSQGKKAPPSPLPGVGNC